LRVAKPALAVRLSAELGSPQSVIDEVISEVPVPAFSAKRG